MTRRDWWLGVFIITAAVATRGCFPRYEWQHVDSNAYVRIDRWGGTLEAGTVEKPDWIWRPVANRTAMDDYYRRLYGPHTATPDQIQKIDPPTGR